MKNRPGRPVEKPVENISMGRERRDFSFDKARPHCADAIDAQIDCDDASGDLIKEELHPNIRLSSNRFDDPAVFRVNRQG
jgi:hypothetical protein